MMIQMQKKFLEKVFLGNYSPVQNLTYVHPISRL